MSAIGYPDFQAPRDYLSGLAGQQVVQYSGYAGSQTVTFYTIPAGSKLIIRSLVIGAAVNANGVGPWGEYGVQINATKGFDGASAAATLANLVARAHISTSNNIAELFPGPLRVDGGATGNTIQVVATAVQAANTEGDVTMYGALVT